MMAKRMILILLVVLVAGMAGLFAIGRNCLVVQGAACEDDASADLPGDLVIGFGDYLQMTQNSLRFANALLPNAATTPLSGRNLTLNDLIITGDLRFTGGQTLPTARSAESVSFSPVANNLPVLALEGASAQSAYSGLAAEFMTATANVEVIFTLDEGNEFVAAGATIPDLLDAIITGEDATFAEPDTLSLLSRSLGVNRVGFGWLGKFGGNTNSLTLDNFQSITPDVWNFGGRAESASLAGELDYGKSFFLSQPSGDSDDRTELPSPTGTTTLRNVAILKNFPGTPVSQTAGVEFVPYRLPAAVRNVEPSGADPLQLGTAFSVNAITPTEFWVNDRSGGDHDTDFQDIAVKFAFCRTCIVLEQVFEHTFDVDDITFDPSRTSNNLDAFTFEGFELNSQDILHVFIDGQIKFPNSAITNSTRPINIQLRLADGTSVLSTNVGRASGSGFANLQISARIGGILTDPQIVEGATLSVFQPIPDQEGSDSATVIRNISVKVLRESVSPQEVPAEIYNYHDVPANASDFRFKKFISLTDDAGCGLLRFSKIPICWGDDNAINDNAPNEIMSTIQLGSGIACGILVETDRLSCWGDLNFFILPNNVDTLTFSQLFGAGRNIVCGILTDHISIECVFAIGTSSMSLSSISFSDPIVSAAILGRTDVGDIIWCAISSVDYTIICNPFVTPRIVPPGGQFSHITGKDNFCATYIDGGGICFEYRSNVANSAEISVHEEGFKTIASGQGGFLGSATNFSCGLSRLGQLDCLGSVPGSVDIAGSVPRAFFPVNTPAGEFDDVAADIGGGCAVQFSGEVICFTGVGLDETDPNSQIGYTPDNLYSAKLIPPAGLLLETH